MKKILITVSFVAILAFILGSCAINLPDSFTIKYSNHFEIPLTVLHFSFDDFASPVISSFESAGFQVTYGEPVVIAYSTSTTVQLSDYIGFPGFDVPVDSTFTVLNNETLVEFSTIEGSETIQNVDFNVNFIVEFESSTTTFDSTLTFLINGTPVVISDNSSETENVSKYLKEVIKSGEDLVVYSEVYINGTVKSSDELSMNMYFEIPLEGTATTDIVLYQDTTDMSGIRSLAEFVDSATVVFDNYTNLLGFDTVFEASDLSFYFGSTPPEVSISKNDLLSLAVENLPFSIKVPANGYFKIKSNSYLDTAIYISLDLTVATEVTF
ncbi:MAG: hypothetical protein H0Z24_07965 [Thermosipho sp. (in: Bacteria)]|nr:hypothetical protein [Thermosipho sp. (in: thermotogales)]